MTVCAPCRVAWHDGCLYRGCVCQHRPPQTPEPSGPDGTTQADESESTT